MNENKHIEPEKITKPIQLLAAWLVGLIVVNGSFLTTAVYIQNPIWITSVLICASVINVPLFLVAIFLLQTKFRPEMQEDSYYSQYLDRKTGYTKREVTAESVATLREEVAKLEARFCISSSDNISEREKLSWSSVTVMLNKNLEFFALLTKSMSMHGIPVHELFGADADVPDIFKVALGNGFSVVHVLAILNVLSDFSDGWILYADDDFEHDQYDRKILIGAYGTYEHGIEISKAKALIEASSMSEEDMYRMLGKGKFNAYQREF